MEPFYNKKAINRYCKTIPVKHCACKLSWLCDGIEFNGKLTMGEPYDAETVNLLREHFNSQQKVENK